MRTAVIVLMLLLAGCGAGEPDAAPPERQPQVSEPTPTMDAVGCSRNADRPFQPTSITVADVTAPLLALPRDGDNVPGVPALTDAQKQVFAWDAPGVKPGTRRGNVLLNTHTWPDGSAMGNRLLRDLEEGEPLVLEGGDTRLCYEVTDRIEVPIENPPLDRVYDTEGPPQAVMIVCSGTRLGPGRWTHRTIWFASPVS